MQYHVISPLKMVHDLVVGNVENLAKIVVPLFEEAHLRTGVQPDLEQWNNQSESATKNRDQTGLSV